MDVVLHDAKDPVAGTDTAILDLELQTYCGIFQCPLHELPDHLEQCGCVLGMKIDLILSGSPYIVRQELEHQASHYGLFSKCDVAEVVDMSGHYLKVVINRTYSALWFNVLRGLRSFLP